MNLKECCKACRGAIPAPPHAAGAGSGGGHLHQTAFLAAVASRNFPRPAARAPAACRHSDSRCTCRGWQGTSWAVRRSALAVVDGFAPKNPSSAGGELRCGPLQAAREPGNGTPQCSASLLQSLSAGNLTTGVRSGGHRHLQKSDFLEQIRDFRPKPGSSCGRGTAEKARDGGGRSPYVACGFAAGMPRGGRGAAHAPLAAPRPAARPLRARAIAHVAPRCALPEGGSRRACSTHAQRFWRRGPLHERPCGARGPSHALPAGGGAGLPLRRPEAAARTPPPACHPERSGAVGTTESKDLRAVPAPAGRRGLAACASVGLTACACAASPALTPPAGPGAACAASPAARRCPACGCRWWAWRSGRSCRSASCAAAHRTG